MVAAWPADLPEYVESGAQERPAEERIDSNADTLGRPGRRRRVRGRVRDFDVSIACTTAQVVALRTFYETTLVSGVLPFTWVNPRTQAPGVFRFQSPPPIYMPRVHGVTMVSFKMIQVR